MKLEIDNHNFSTWLRTATYCRNLVFQSLDLRPHDSILSALPQAEKAEDGCVFLGCQLGPQFAATVATHHGLIFPDLPRRPYQIYRRSLYSPLELFDRFYPSHPESYRNCMDWKTYISFIKTDADNRPLKPIQYVDIGPDEFLARDSTTTSFKTKRKNFWQHSDRRREKALWLSWADTIGCAAIRYSERSHTWLAT